MVDNLGMSESQPESKAARAVIPGGKSVFVFGFPHSGTTILRTLIGRCGGIKEVVDETTRPPDESQRYVFKWPYAEETFCHREEYHMVFILRNPLFAFSSILRRFPARELPPGHSVEDWERAAELFIRKRGSRVMTILYEDMFLSSHKLLRTLIQGLGLKFEEHILYGIEQTRPAPSPSREHSSYRYWQVSQAFRCMNRAVELPEHLAARIVTLPAYCELWRGTDTAVSDPMSLGAVTDGHVLGKRVFH